MNKLLSQIRRLAGRIGKAVEIFAVPDYRRGLRHGVGAAIEHSALIGGLPLRTVIDVGANVGQFALLVRHLHPNCRIVAFEPLAKPAAVFVRVFADVPDVTLHRSAVGPERGNCGMHVSRRADSSSLLPITAEQADQFPGTEEEGREEVRVAPLTDFFSGDDLGAQSLLKIDVQGFELDVLRSGEPLLPHLDWIYLEVSFARLYEGQPLASEIVTYLADRGFALHGIGNITRGSTGHIVQADFLFAGSGPAR